jgi:hypothetical protein
MQEDARDASDSDGSLADVVEDAPGMDDAGGFGVPANTMNPSGDDGGRADAGGNVDGDLDADGFAADLGPPARCSPAQPFGTPNLVADFDQAAANVDSARLSVDELTVYLGMFHGTSVEMYVATRADVSDLFGPPTPIAALDGSGTINSYGTLTADGLALYMESTRSGRYSLYASKRSSLSSTFSEPAEMDELNAGPTGNGNPYVVPDGSALYFHNDRNGNFDIYRAARNGAAFDSPMPIGIDTSGDEQTPIVSADDLTLYYERPGNALARLWRATRQSRSDDFSNPVPLTELNGPLTVLRPGWISPDECRLYIQEQDSFGGIFIYVAERKPDAAP